MIYLYYNRSTPTATRIAAALGATRCRMFDGMKFLDGTRLEKGDTVICWDGHIPKLDFVNVINSRDESFTTKEQIQILERNMPMAHLYNRLTQIPKSHHPHVMHSADVMNKLVYCLPYDTEYRVHVCNKKIIRAGVKAVRPEFELGTIEQWQKDSLRYAHPTYRSESYGWYVKYEGFTSNAEIRTTAKNAIAVLGLDFGVVNILSAQGALYVRPPVVIGPHLDADTEKFYVKALQQLIEVREPSEKPKKVVPAAAPPVVDNPFANMQWIQMPGLGNNNINNLAGQWVAALNNPPNNQEGDNNF